MSRKFYHYVPGGMHQAVFQELLRQPTDLDKPYHACAMGSVLVHCLSSYVLRVLKGKV